ncbi:MAG: fumarylacetoacetate hydrolase family protein [Caldilineaceae bacterium]|nr:fumarylacetoacetate hydrolase family protein [Caldilineaceae bacterium]MBP8123071.1 fumarylacetoacetate hydrolase family protein [Caldilineaceae bacterium]MBP9073391.1 fumarylacetoacetate hydrolase family protein [Caldilineaceae bacterium]
MKLVTFVLEGNLRLGALTTADGRERVYDLNHLDPRIPDNILAFLEAGQAALTLAHQALATATPNQGLDPSEVQIKAPIPRPGKIICIGQNYLAHAQEANASASPFPIIFSKFNNTVIAHRDSIVIPSSVKEPDYEGELAVVIGRRGRNIPEAEALNYVAGYMPLNDVSARDLQMRTSQWVLGKSPDTFCPMGPALVTADEIPDVQNLSIRTIIGGEVLQEGHTSLMIFTVAHLIADMSQVMTLEPGDVIATGTPAGIGAARTPPRWLKPGDVVRIEIEKIGVLENPVVAES